MGRRATACAGRLPALSAPRFVGRERELAALGDAFAQPPAVVFLEAEAGIGKTRLLREFMASPPGRRRRTLVGACLPLREPYTLGPVVDAVRGGTDNVSGLRLSGLAGALRPLFPEWAADLAPTPEPLEDATAVRHRLFRAIVEVLDRLKVEVLALEDVHWSDEATLEFLLFLVSRVPQPVSVVVSYRPEEMSADSLLRRVSSRLRADAHLVRIGLKPLDVGETAAFVSSMLADEHVSAEFVTLLHRGTEGVPLAIEESVQLMHDRADLVRHGGAWARRRLDRIEVPPAIRDAVLERVGRFRPDTRTVLHAAAVLADPADFAVLTAVTGLPDGHADAPVAEALGCGLLREDARGHWSFRHSLACRAVYETIPAHERRAMHLRAGRALERVAPLPVAQLARHFREAGETEAWCRYGEQAADLSTQSGDVATAALLLHNLVATVALPVESLVRLVTKIEFESLPGADPYSKIVESLRSALDGDTAPDQAAAVRFQLGHLLMMAGALEAGRLETARAVEQLPPDSLEAAQARIFLALPTGTPRPAAEHLRWLRDAPAVASSIERRERLRLVVGRTLALLLLGEEGGWAEARQIPDDAPDPREARTVVIGHMNVGDMAMRWGRYDEARQRLARASELVDRHQFPGLLGTIAATQAHLDWFTGAWDGLADRAAALVDDHDDVRLKDRCEAALVAGLMQTAAGDRERGVERLLFAASDDQQRIASAAALAQLWLRDGGVEDALRTTEEAAEITIHNGVWAWATEVAPVRVDALVAAGRIEEAGGLVTALQAAAGGTSAPALQASFALCRAILAEAGGRSTDAAALFARAAAAWQALPRPYDVLLVNERHARCLLAAGQDKTGLSMLSEVLRGFSALGARNDADRVSQTLHEHGWNTGVARGRGRPSYGNQLSPRELEVARLLVGGRTNRQIAGVLIVSTQTVATQLKSAMRKLRVPSRTALALKIVELGLVDDDGRPPPGSE